jgi:hypothetical protein
MTVLCGGGSSSIRPGVAAVVAYTSGLIADLLVLVESPWLIPVIPLLSLPNIGTAAFCSTDPPAQPTFTSAEATALLELKVGTSDWNSGVAKISDLLLNAIWSQLCECTSGATPGPSPAPAPPAGTVINIYTSQPNFTPCFELVLTTASSFPSSGTFTLAGGIVIPVGATTLTLKLINTIAVGSGATASVTIEQDNNTTVLHTDTVTATPGQTVTRSFPVVANANKVFLSYVGAGGTGNSFITNSVFDIYCGNSTAPSQTNPCGPDPTTVALLNAIMQLVTLIQRQIVPFSYISGTTHSGLTGTGELNVQGILGVKVLPSSIPNSAGIVVGDPDTLWLDSWINWGNADGWTERQFLTNSPFVSMPRLASQFTKLGYSLRPGLTVDITELVREF